jgi:phosphoribosyl 1,2-cyclic phosphodiesterase
MSLLIASLNSGSNANCYYIGNNNEAVLIDVGLSCRETEKRMQNLRLDIGKLKAIFISHEHTDHIAGLPVISKKFRLPVYITHPTLQNSRMQIDPDLVHSFSSKKEIIIGGLTITPFQKSHDADDPHSFMIPGNGINVGVITDIGYACRRVIKYFKQCDAAFLESNYCEDMLANGSYPAVLKKRITSNKGHLSNDQALELFLNHRTERLKLLVLSHLSQNNNHPDTVTKTFSKHAGNVKIVVASRYKESELFIIEKETNKPARSLGRKQKNNKLQLSLFD